MKDRTAPARWWRERGLLAALLLVLASALVPALLPSGSPLSRLHGSAFDPTTSTVTLRVRDERARIATPPADDGSGRAQKPQVPPALHPASLAEATRLAAFLALTFIVFASAPPAPPRRAGIALPRAPPLALPA